MRFSKTSEYAIRVLTFMVKEDKELFSANYLHKTLNIPNKYLGRLMSKLKKAGFLESTMGKQGGYKIYRDEESIFLYEIIEVTEGLERLNECILGFPECSDKSPCAVHKYWVKPREKIRNMLYNVSLAQIASGTDLKV